MAINLDHVTEQITVTDTATNADLTYVTKGAGIHKFNSGGGQVFATLANSTSPVNSLVVYGSTNSPQVRVEGASAAIDLEFLSKSTGGFRFFTQGVGYAEQFRIANTTSSVNYLQVVGSATGQSPVIYSQGSDTNIPVSYTSKGNLGHDFYTNGFSFAKQFVVAHTASAVNYVQVTGGSTTNNASISTAGSDTNVSLTFQTKAAGSYAFITGGGRQVDILNVNSAVNRMTFVGSATGFGVVLSAAGSDTNIPLVLQPKGTGALQAQLTDSTATGGNARGANAVDWQTKRNNAAQVASGSASTIGGGNSNTANGFEATIGGGTGNTVSNNYSVVSGGYTNVAFGSHSAIVGGYSNTTSGLLNFIGGGFTNSGTSGSSVTTQSATMNGTTAVTLSGSNGNIKVGQLVIGTSIQTFPYTYVAAISGTSLTLSQAAIGSSTSTLSFFTPHGVVVGGGNNTATGSYSFIGGGGDAGTAGNRNVASGDWSVVGGGTKNTASGNHSSVSGGYGAIASGIASFVGGGGLYGDFGSGATAPNTASGVASSVVGGFNNTSSSNGTAVIGSVESVANGLYSAVFGGSYGTTRGLLGNIVFPANNNPLNLRGGSQSALLVIAAETTNATATVLRSNSGAASNVNQVIMPNNSAYFFTGEVVAGVTGGGDTKGWTIEGVIKRGANAASTALVGTPTVTSTYADAGASTWVIAVTADTTNGGLAVTFTGQAATTIRTVARINSVEMTF